MTLRSRTLPLVGLYAGAGGLDFGFKAAGFDLRVALEMDRDACETLRANGVAGVVDQPIERVSSAALLERAGCKKGEIAALIGGPPCQPFSKSGYWSRGDTLRLEDPRARTLDEFMRCVEGLLPMVFVIENVYGIGYEGKAEGIELIERLTNEINLRQHTRIPPREEAPERRRLRRPANPRAVLLASPIERAVCSSSRGRATGVATRPPGRWSTRTMAAPWRSGDGVGCDRRLRPRSI